MTATNVKTEREALMEALESATRELARLRELVTPLLPKPRPELQVIRGEGEDDA